MHVGQTAKRTLIVTLVLVALSLTMIAGIAPANFQEVISLPPGIAPEGIASGGEDTFYVGSLASGAIYRGDLRTGEVELVVPEDLSRTPAVGLKFDRRTDYLFVAGGATGAAYIYDATSGELIQQFQLSSEPSFINDVVITRDAAYFTNSLQPEIYQVPLRRNGRLPDSQTFDVIRLTGDYQQVDGFNANGIEATHNDKWLIVVNSTLGALYRVDPDTGEATLIDLGGANVQNGDGILLHERTLYVVQNRLNQVAVVELNARFTEGEVVETLSRPEFDVPTTIARFGNTLYVVNARFGTEVTPTTEYDVVMVPE